MKKYKITQSFSKTQVFEVEAPTEDQALKAVLEGKAKLVEEKDSNKHISSKLIPSQ